MGIDYGLGQTNIDKETGIRFGVIPAKDLGQPWYDSVENYYDGPRCPKCGNECHSCNNDDLLPVIMEDAASNGEPIDEEAAQTLLDSFEVDGCGEYTCVDCKKKFDADDAFGECVSCYIDDDEYSAEQECGSYATSDDIFISKSPYYTFGPLCSPCAPGAVYLRNANVNGEAQAYCFAPDWFECYSDNCTGRYNGEKTSCPYPVYRVEDDVCVFSPDKKEGE